MGLLLESEKCFIKMAILSQRYAKLFAILKSYEQVQSKDMEDEDNESL